MKRFYPQCQLQAAGLLRRRPFPYLMVSLSPYLMVSLSPYLMVSLFPYLMVSLSPYLMVSLFPYLMVSLFPYLMVSLFPYLMVSLSNHAVSLRSFDKLRMRQSLFSLLACPSNSVQHFTDCP